MPAAGSETAGSSSSPSNDATQTASQDDGADAAEANSASTAAHLNAQSSVNPINVSATPLIAPRIVRKDKPWKRHDANLQGIALRAMGVRTSFASVPHNGSSAEHPLSGAISERGIGLLDYGVFDARYFDYMELGGDADGWVYRAEGQLSVGPRWRWTQFTSAALRLGGRAHIARQGGLFSSDIRAPTLSAAFRHESSRLHLDAAVEYAPVLAGYFEPEGNTYRLNKSQAGAALLSVSWDRLRIDAEFTRYWRETEAEAIHEGRAWGCVYLGWGLLCLDGRLWGVAGSDRASQVSGYSAGLSALIAKYDWLHSD